MFAWGIAGQYSMLSELGGADGRLAANSLAGAQVSLAVIVGPALAGGLISGSGPGWLVALDAASFAFLGIQAWRTHTGVATVALAIAASIVWTRDRAGAPDRYEGERGSLDTQRT